MSEKSEGDTTAKSRGQFASGPRREGRAGTSSDGKEG